MSDIIQGFSKNAQVLFWLVIGLGFMFSVSPVCAFWRISINY